MRALVVDDAMHIRTLFVRLLTMLGWEAVTAGNGQEALDAFETGRFNLVMMDVELGDGPDGIEVAEKFRKLEPGLRIVMFSGNLTNETRVEQTGFGPLLAKPFDIENVKSILHSQSC